MQGQRKLPREAKQELRPRLSRRSLQGEDTVAPPRGLDGRWGTVWLKPAFGWIFLTVIPSANGPGFQGQNLMLQIFLNQNHLQGCLSLQSSHTIRLAPEAILVLTGESVKAGGTGPGRPVFQLNRRDFQGDWPGDLPKPV